MTPARVVVPAILMIALSGYMSLKVPNEWSSALTTGQRIATIMHGAYGVLGVLAGLTALWRQRRLGTILVLWLVAITATAALAPLVWGGASWPVAILSGLAGGVVGGLLAWWLHAASAPSLWEEAPRRSMVERARRLSVRHTLPAFDRAISGAREQGKTAAAPFTYGWFSRWMVASMEPPPKRRMGTFRIFSLPQGATYSGEEVLSEFLSMRDELAMRVRDSDGLDLARVRVISPVNRLLRLPLGAYLAFVIAHDRRHLWQARQVRNTSGFGT